MDIRPVVVGYVWRQFAEKCAGAHAIDTLADYFTPLQLGVGVPGGCKAAVHSTRQFQSNMRDDYIIAKLDFSDASNCLHWDAMLECVKQIIPELTSFVSLQSAFHFPDYHADAAVLDSNGTRN